MTWGDWVFAGICDIFALIFLVVLLRTIWTAKNAPRIATTGNAAVAAAVAVFCVLMGNPDRFQKISFSPSGGVIAEARQTIQQVQVTVEQLQKLAATFAEGSLSQLVFSGAIFYWHVNTRKISSARRDHPTIKRPWSHSE
jgi:hypothetical protein